MDISFNSTSILLENPTAKEHFKYLTDVEAYNIPKSKKFKIPLTKSSLDYLIHTFNINIQEYKTLLWKLELAKQFNLFNITEQGTADLRWYQLQGVNWINNRINQAKSLFLFWPPRTGKTRVSVFASKNYNRLIVLALAGQEDNWKNNYEEFSNHKIILLSNKSPNERLQLYKEFNNSENVVLIGSINTITNDVLNKTFYPTQYDMLIIDEVHKCKNNSTKLSIGTKTLRHKSHYALGLTGTPVSKATNEILPLFTLMYPFVFSKTFIGNYFFTKQKNFYTKYGQIDSVKKYKKAEWLEFLSLYASQITKQEALDWAIEVQEEVIKLEMTGKQLDLYKDLLFNLEITGDDTETEQIQEVIVQFLRLKQIALHPKVLGIQSNSIKEDWLLQYIQQYSKQEAIIIFSTQTAYINLLYEKIKNTYRVGLITGATKNKTIIAQDFQDKKYDIILANIQAGSKGITLDRANTIIFLDQDWRPDENQQAKERFTATSIAKVLLNQKVLRLEISNTFKMDNEIVNSIDYYINQVVSYKIKQSTLINKFKELLKKT